jgi:hypothetical protein
MTSPRNARRAPSVQVFLEQDERRVLPIPYRTEGEPGRRFWNLKRDAGLASRVKELSKGADLADLVLGLNRPESRFATLGCDQWIKRVRHGAVTCEAGSYVDIVFDRLELAAKRERYLDWVRRLRARAARAGAGTHPDGVTIIRAQLQRVEFAGLGRRSAWLVSTWVFGGGASRPVAIACRRRGLDEVARVCAAVSREVESAAGRSGTPVPP